MLVRMRGNVMPTFMETCNCRGTRPLGVIGKRYVSRPDIVGSLLKDRHVSRFIVAPTGFGKSNVAYEYANIVFGFQHVFWIRCTSPCFLRDLDAGILYSGIMSCDPNIQLAVFEDVPSMDPHRCELLSELMNSLLEIECEVVVTCTPSADTFSGLQLDRFVVHPKDLMVTDNELTIEELRGGIGEDWRERIKPNERIACNIWGDDATFTMLRGLRDEDLPKEIKLSMLILLLGRSGMIDSLAHFVTREHIDEIASILESDYPMLGVESRTKSYSAPDVSVYDIASIFCSKMDEVLLASLYSDRDKLSSAIADWLCDDLKTSRACEVMDVYATKGGSAKWLARCGWKMLVSLDPLSCVKLHDASRRGASGLYEALSAIKAWGSYLLCDEEQAVKHARRLLRSSAARAEERICAAVLLCLIGDVPSLPEAFSFLGEGGSIELKGMDSQTLYDAVDWKKVAKFAHSDPADKPFVLQSEYALMTTSAATSSSGPTANGSGVDLSRNTFLLEIAWTLEEAISLCSDAAGRSPFFGRENVSISSGDVASVCMLAIDVLRASEDRVDLFGMLAIQAIDEISTLLPKFDPSAIDAGFETLSHRAKADLLQQREDYRRYLTSGIETKLEFQRSNPDPFRRIEVKDSGSLMKNNIPALHVDLFGGMQVRIGDELIATKMLSRKKTKLLLAMLVINRGREVSKSQIVKMLWPEGDVDTYKRNFYSVWSQLKKALSYNGSCPYLIRTQSGCRLDGRYLQSDIVRFDELCRTLLFGSENPISWEMLYSQVSEEFSEDLLPSLIGNDEIDLLRDKYRESLIDGLIATSARLNSMGEPRGALWFAREAIRRNDKREDAYIALMEAQISSNQRGGALETYFTCRRFLSEELGIDPSMKVMELYRSIIECEEVFE